MNETVLVVSRKNFQAQLLLNGEVKATYEVGLENQKIEPLSRLGFVQKPGSEYEIQAVRDTEFGPIAVYASLRKNRGIDPWDRFSNMEAPIIDMAVHAEMTEGEVGTYSSAGCIIIPKKQIMEVVKQLPVGTKIRFTE